MMIQGEKKRVAAIRYFIDARVHACYSVSVRNSPVDFGALKEARIESSFRPEISHSEAGKEGKTMPRIPLLSPEGDLTLEQRRAAKAILERRGEQRIPGPYRFFLHCPELAEILDPVGELLRLKSGFPLRLSELAILITARTWDCDYVFQAHAPHALKGGLTQSVIDALARGERPAFDRSDEEVFYDYCTELFERHAVSDKSYARAFELFGIPGVVELTALIGYFSMVAMTLLAHDMPLPAGVRPPLARPKKSSQSM